MGNDIQHRRFWIRIENSKAILDSEELKHIRVQRLKLGDEFIGIDGCGYEYLCKIESIGSRNVVATIEYERCCSAEPETEIILCQAELKSSGLSNSIDFSIQAGISKFIYFPTIRSEGRDISRSRIERKMMSSVKQSGRAKIISVERYSNVDSVLKDISIDEIPLKLLLVLDGGSKQVNGVLLKEKRSPSRVAIVVGPEGDFTDEERDIFIKSGFLPVNIGSIRIRSYLVGAFTTSIILNYFEKGNRRREEKWRTVSFAR